MGIDLYIDRLIQNYPPPFFLENLGLILNKLGKGDVLAFLSILVLVAGYFLGRSNILRSGAGGLLTVIVSGLTVQLIKHLCGRARPQMNLGDFYFIGPNLFKDGFDSFPSGHATATFAIATFFSYFFPRFKTPLYTLASAISLIGRVFLRHHFFLDVIAGACLGFFIGMILAEKLEPWIGKSKECA